MKSADAIADEFKCYAYSVSHDVSAPVRAMVEFSKLLLSEDAHGLSAEGQEYLALIVENGQKLQAMMEALLQYSRLNSLQEPFTKVNLTTVTAASIAALQSRIAESDAVITVDHLPVINAVAAQMQQLFEMLIENALLYQAKGITPCIHISSQSHRDTVVICIADNGIGVEESRREVIFQPFKRLHTEDEYPGVGMGLTITKKIVEYHGGVIHCTENAGGGCVFSITLPRKES